MRGTRAAQRLRRVALVLLLSGCGTPRIVQSTPVRIDPHTTVRARVEVPLTCPDTPTFKWLSSTELRIACDGRTVHVDAEGREVPAVGGAAMVGAPTASTPAPTDSASPAATADTVLREYRLTTWSLDARRASIVFRQANQPDRYVGMSGELSAVQLSPDGARAAAACGPDGHREVCLFDLDRMVRLPLQTSALRQTAVVRRLIRNSQGTRVVATFSDGAVRAWDMLRGSAATRRNSFREQESCAMTFSPEGGQLVLARRWWAKPETEPASTGTNRDDLTTWNVGHADDRALPIADLYAGTDRWFLSANQDGSLELRRTRGGPLLASLWPIAHSDSGYVIAPDGRYDTWGPIDPARILRCTEDGADVPFDACLPRRTPGLVARVLEEAGPSIGPPGVGQAP